jgi:short subunit dehydrogenase-like uncharacterized protein
MSVEAASVQVYNEPAKEMGLTVCPHCGFKVPDSIIICWKCGTRLKK